MACAISGPPDLAVGWVAGRGADAWAPRCWGAQGGAREEEESPGRARGLAGRFL